MMSYMRAVALGRMVDAPTIKKIGELSLALFSFAVNYKTKKKTETSFFNVECWGRQADVLGDYGSKGKQLLVEGRIRQDHWQDDMGQKRSKFVFVCEKYIFITDRPDQSVDTLRDPETGQHDLPF